MTMRYRFASWESPVRLTNRGHDLPQPRRKLGMPAFDVNPRLLVEDGTPSIGIERSLRRLTGFGIMAF